MCELSDLFGGETDSENKENTVLIIDGHNIAYRCLYSNIYRNPDDVDTFNLWKHSFLNDIFNVVTKFNPDKLVLVFDEKGSWRYDIYPNYKAQRKVARKKNKLQLDWDNFFNIFESFIADMKNTFTNMYIIKAPRTEGDDIIGVCVNELFNSDEVYIVSNDGDMRQLLVNPNIHQYDPKSRSVVECMNPAIELELKILTGDSSDFITGVRYGVGKVTAGKIIKMGLDEYVNTLKIKVNRKMKKREWMNEKDVSVYCPIENDDRESLTKEEINYFIAKEKKQIYLNYNRNSQLIDFKKIPDDIKNEIINIYTRYDIKPIDGQNVVSFFIKHKLTNHLTNWNQTSKYFKQLK